MSFPDPAPYGERWKVNHHRARNWQPRDMAEDDEPDAEYPDDPPDARSTW